MKTKLTTSTEIINKLREIVNLLNYGLQEVDNQWLLQETDPKAKLKKVFISEVTDTNCAFKLDGENPNHICLYLNKSAEFVHQGCDGIIFTEFEGKPYIIFCEMKSEFPKEKDYKPQFINALCFVDYLEVLLKRFYDYDFSNFKKQFILFYYSKENTPMQNFGSKHKSVAIDEKHKVRNFPNSKTEENYLSLSEILRHK